MLGAPLPGFDGAAAGDPDGRVWLLDGSGPDVDVSELVVSAVVGEHLGTCPGLGDEVGGFVVLVAEVCGVGAVAEAVVHGGADGEAGDESTAGDAVEHGEFFGDASGRVVEGDGVAQDDDGGVFGATAEVGGHEVGAGHHAVGVLVVFVDADAVVAVGGGGFQLVQGVVVHVVGFDRVEQVGGDVDPDAGVAFGEVLGQVPVGHEVEELKFHGPRPLSARVRALFAAPLSGRRRGVPLVAS